MAEYFTPVRSVKGYFKEFAVEAIGKQHADTQLVKQQILDAFRKEIFGQLMMRFGDPSILAVDNDKVDEKTRQGIRNILDNSIRKWNRLCIVFSQYRETRNLLFPGDLKADLGEIVKAQTGEDEIVKDDETEGIIYEQ